MTIPRTNPKRPMITLALTALATLAPLGHQGVDMISRRPTSSQRTTPINNNKYNANRSISHSITCVTYSSNGEK